MAGTWKLVYRILLLRREREQKLRRGKHRLSLGLLRAGHMTYEKKPINHSRHQYCGDHEAGGSIIKLISGAGVAITNYGSGFLLFYRKSHNC
jgi:hypothetical protein